MTQYIVACQYSDKERILNMTTNLLQTMNFLRVERWVWYDDDVYAPMVPFRSSLYKQLYPYWCDIVEEKCKNRICDAIHKMNIILKNEIKIDDMEEYEEIIQWLTHWTSKGAYFMLVKHKYKD